MFFTLSQHLSQARSCAKSKNSSLRRRNWAEQIHRGGVTRRDIDLGPRLIWFQQAEGQINSLGELFNHWCAVWRAWSARLASLAVWYGGPGYLCSPDQWSVCALKTPGMLFLPLVVVEVRTSPYLFALTVYCVCPSDGGSANSLLSLEHPMGWLDEINE